MADVDSIRRYARGSTPTLDGGDREYLQRELDKLQQTIRSLITVMTLLEARIVALEP
jgi:hypothetical protein